MNDIKRRSTNLRSNIKTPLAPKGDFAQRGKVITRNYNNTDKTIKSYNYHNDTKNHKDDVINNKNKSLSYKSPLSYDKREEKKKLIEKLELFEKRTVGATSDISTPRDDIFKNANNRKSKSINRKYYIYTSLFVIAIVSILLLLTFVFNKAYVYVTPKNINYQLPDNFKLTIDKNKDKNDNNYELIKVEKLSSSKISKSETKNVQQKAVGEITIYNYFDKAQKLIKNTRFTADDNKTIYKINNTIIVDPNKSVKVGLIAENYGAEYNLPIGNKLTVVNFKNSNKYNKIYGEVTTEIKGGENSTKSLVAQEDIDKNNEKMRNELTDKIKSDLIKTNKSGFVSATDTIYITWSDNRDDYESDRADSYIVTGTGYKALINSDELAKSLATKVINGYKGESIRLANNDFIIKYNGKDSINNATDTLDIIMSGHIKLIYKIRSDDLKSSLVNKVSQPSVIEDILFKDKTLDYATSKIFPL
ncbi:MAG: hypothetical protein QM532_00175 [Cyanobium sp. MAG06]|nr:hypothetical protein [Cyanobium sp. MAG06]